MTLSALQIIPNDLVHMTLQINTDHLFSVLQTLVETVNRQQNSIERLERNTTALFQKMELNHGLSSKRFEKLESLKGTTDVSSRFNTIDSKLTALEELITSEREKSIEEQRVVNDRHNKEIEFLKEELNRCLQQVRNDVETKASQAQIEGRLDILQKEILLSNESLQKEVNDRLEDTRDAVRRQMNAVFDRVEEQRDALEKNNASVKKLAESIAYAKDLVNQATEEITASYTRRFVAIEEKVEYERPRVDVLYRVLRIDESAIRMLFRETHAQSSKTMDRLRSDKTFYDHTIKKAVMRPIRSQERSVMQQILGEKPGEQSTKLIHPELDEFYTKILLETPPFKYLLERMTEQLGNLSVQKSKEVSHVKEQHEQRFKNVEKELEKKINRDTLDKLVDEHKDIKTLKGLYLCLHDKFIMATMCSPQPWLRTSLQMSLKRTQRTLNL